MCVFSFPGKYGATLGAHLRRTENFDDYASALLASVPEPFRQVVRVIKTDRPELFHGRRADLVALGFTAVEAILEDIIHPKLRLESYTGRQKNSVFFFCLGLDLATFYLNRGAKATPPLCS